MTKIAAAVIALLVATQRADACTDADLIPDWVGWGLGAGLVGGYLYGTGYFIDQDLTTDRHDDDYIGGSLAFNGVASSMWGLGAYDAISHGRASAIPLTAMTLLHGTLAVHAASRIELGSPRIPSNAVLWTAGTIYALETIGFVEGADGHHGRDYGVFEAAVQTPIAAGLAYLSIDRWNHASSGEAMLFGGMAAISGALAVHGFATAISPYHAPKLDLLGTDVMPTVVDDGKEVGPGLGASGTW
jgi:hypothetical protein